MTSRLSLIVPAFNEAERLPQRATLLRDAVAEGALCPRTTDLIVVDDGSTDETAWRAEELLASTFEQFRVLRLHENAGKGAAVRLGIAAASAPVVLFMDADMSVNPREIPHLVKAIGPADVAIGSRSHIESVVVTDGRQRKLMGRAFNGIVSQTTRLPYRDTQCGFKAFRTPLARLLFHLMRARRFAFDVELLRLAHEMKMEIAEVAVQWRQIGQSTVRLLMDPLTMTRDVLRLSTRREWPKLPALAVTPVAGEHRRSPSRIVGDIYRTVGPNFPIMMPAADEYLLLLPLCNPVETQALASRLRGIQTRLSVRERSVSLPEVMQLGPFRCLDTSEGLAIASREDTSGLTIERPAEGWESLRPKVAVGPNGRMHSRVQLNSRTRAFRTPS